MDNQIEHKNEAIARFINEDKYQKSEDVEYHTSWDKLMEVWEDAYNILCRIIGELPDEKFIDANRIIRGYAEACQKADKESAHDQAFNAIQFINEYNKKE